MDAPRDNLIRKTALPSMGEDGRTMTGYPIVFNSWTTIDSWEGQFKERIAPEAITRTLRNNRDQIKVLFNHGMDRSIGEKPLGKPSVMKADATGLYVEVPLSRTSYNEDLLALMQDGAIDGQSFRFSVTQEEWSTPKGKMPERTITELKLYEFGPVTFPAYQATTIGVRSLQGTADLTFHPDALTDERRDAIRAIMETDLRTLDFEPAPEHLDDETRAEEPEDPPTGHSEEPVSRRAHAALRRARMRNLGVLNEPSRGEPQPA